MSGDLIREGDMVAILMHDDKSTNIVKVRGEQKIGKMRLNMKPLIGHPFESVFEIRDKTIIRVVDDPDFLEKAFDEVQTPGSGDNSTFIDTNTAQKLDFEDIQELKDSGATGIDIMKSLIANSETWGAKNEFAQQKWLQRKSRKYMRRFRVCKSTPALLCEVTFNKNMGHTCGLRGDSLAQVLSHGGVYAGARVLVCETTLGLVVGSIAYRMRGHGRILSLFTGQQPHLEFAERMNLSESDLSVIRSIPCNLVGAAVDDVSSQGFNVSVNSGSMDLTEPRPNGRPRGKPHQGSCRKPEEVERARLLLREGVNSLVIVSNFLPLAVLQEAIYLLAPSSPFVVFCEFMEPLVACYLFLQERGVALRMTLSDTWTREYQTLPGRFHPHMNMSTSSGFILTGIYIGSIVIPPKANGTKVATEQVEKDEAEKTEEDIKAENTAEGLDRSAEPPVKRGRK